MFLGTTGAGVAAAVLPAAQAVAQARATSKSGSVILFQGDSITDAGRDRGHQGEPNNQGALGHGYPLFITAYLLATQPKLGLKFYNRGNSGNRVPDLDARWGPDCIDIKPDLVSILIGVNDIWRKFDSGSTATTADYENQYTALLKRTKESLPAARIVVCEPFVLRCGVITDKWFPEFDERRAAAKKVAQAAGAVFVPFQTMFDEAVSGGTEPGYWAADGVHPTMAGHSLMSIAWVKTALG
jgi:lysophospholipase L1-like esterase